MRSVARIANTTHGSFALLASCRFAPFSESAQYATWVLLRAEGSLLSLVVDPSAGLDHDARRFVWVCVINQP